MEVGRKVKETLKDLISIPSPSGKEGRVQKYIEEKLKALGLSPLRQEVERGRFNLLLKGDSEYLISCHVDTVPPIRMRNAYRPLEKNGTIRGRGASDVKGAIASLLTAVEVSRKVPVSLAFVVDEENNSALGSERILSLLEDIKYVLVLEPTYGTFCTKQMGALEFTLSVEGTSVHGAEFERVENPIRVLFEAVLRIEEKLSRKANLIMVRGGSKHYVVPQECKALLEVKVFEGERWEEVERKIKEAVEGISKGCRVIYRREDAEDFIDFSSEDFARFLMDCYEEATGVKPKIGVMPSWTDAANYWRAGKECVVFGHGSLMDSHTERESIHEEDLLRMTLFFLKLFEKLR